jgi:hypothetical protein
MVADGHGRLTCRYLAPTEDTLRRFRDEALDDASRKGRPHESGSDGLLAGVEFVQVAVGLPLFEHGRSHVIEHALMRYVEFDPHEAGFQRIERFGGARNSVTTSDATVLYMELPREPWEMGLWLESLRMAFLLSVLDQPRLEHIRAVVKREWAERVGRGLWAV